MIGFWFAVIALALLLGVWISAGGFGRIKTLVILLSTLCIPVCSGLLYGYWGASVEVARAQSDQARLVEVDQRIRELGSRTNVISMLERQVKKRENDPKGWYLLGKLYLGGGQLNQAMHCLRRAHKLDASSIEIKVALATGLFYQHEKRLTHEAKNLLASVIKKDAQQINALNLLALDAYNRHEDAQAVQYWEKILPQLPEDSENAKAVLTMIAKAQKRLQITR